MSLQYKEYGIVKAIRGCIITVGGFNNCINGQLVRFGYGTEGIIIGFDQLKTDILLTKITEPVTTGDKATMTLEPFNTPVGDGFIGRVVSVLGEPLDGLGQIKPNAFFPIFAAAPKILDREILKDTLETGVKILDTIIPIGKGQRQLILGDKMTGKTTVGTDIIVNQKGKNVICIYCAIGKSRTAISRVVDLFKKFNCFEYTILVAAKAGTAPGQQYLAPYASCSLGEYFMQKGRDVLVIFDDFTKHAWAYREISLLLERPPGRESYPGDIFYLHSRMIERAAKLTQEKGGGSMTFLPLVELLEGDLTGYVPSNLVSMTDGQIYLSGALFGEGFKPAIGVGLSVSRIGSKVQWPAIKKVSKTLRLEYVQYQEVVRVSRLKASGQTEEMAEQLKSGEALSEFLKQDRDSPVPLEAQVLIFYSLAKKMTKDLNAEELIKFKGMINTFAQEHNPGLLARLREKKDFDEAMEKEIADVISACFKKIFAERPKEEEEALQDVTITEKSTSEQK